VTRRETIMQGAAMYAAFYRKNPHIFAEQYLRIRLKLFQKILLLMMNICVNSVFIGSRGIGKTYLTALFCHIRCILYPATHICIASGTRGQSNNLLEKIWMEIRTASPASAAEINEKDSHFSGNNAIIVYKNGSIIEVVTAGDSARGHRAHILVLDEFRLIPREIIDTILRKFLTLRRMPLYADLTEEERRKEYDKEKNQMIFCSSAYFSDNWSYEKCLDTYKTMLVPGRRDFVCALPYELSIKEGLLDPDVVESEMLETSFSEIKHLMEYEAVFYNSSEGAFFDYNVVSKNRHIMYPMLPDALTAKLRVDKDLRIIPKVAGEKRIISVDIALMASTKYKNDATAIHITRLLPTKAGRYSVNLVYSTSSEGLRTEEQALQIRRLYEEYACDYIVLDAKNVGLSVYDCLSNDMVDPDSGEIFPALTCCNNDELAARCVSKTAPKAIWAIFGSTKFNSEAALLLREGFKSGRVRMLVNEYDGEDALKKLPGFEKLPEEDKMQFLMPYINTTLLINELVNLKHEESNGVIRVFEKSTMRKDRYSSLSYNYYVALQLENEMRRNNARNINMGDDDFFEYRAPKIMNGRR